ncbi:MAG: hypothetical protein LBR45_04880 [Bacteroidales bacterium]|jgi:hypothetical protein|nr:hypothetical protein [Bacteroidales bacterium]
MKTILRIILCLVTITLFTLIGCEKQPDKDKQSEIEYVKTELGGCNIRSEQSIDSTEIESDTVIITISEDSVNVFVGLAFTCKVEPFETQTEVTDSIIYMYIKDICYDGNGNEVSCGYERCYCYYTFDFAFKHQGEINRKYKILLYSGFQSGNEEAMSIISEGVITNNTKLCAFDNPLTDLLWLKDVVNEINLTIQNGTPLSVSIYQCIYGNDETGFLVDQGNMKPFYNCNGEILCIMGGYAGETCSELGIINMELILEINP